MATPTDSAGGSRRSAYRPCVKLLALLLPSGGEVFFTPFPLELRIAPSVPARLCGAPLRLGTRAERWRLAAQLPVALALETLPRSKRQSIVDPIMTGAVPGSWLLLHWIPAALLDASRASAGARALRVSRGPLMLRKCDLFWKLDARHILELPDPSPLRAVSAAAIAVGPPRGGCDIAVRRLFFTLTSTDRRSLKALRCHFM